MINRTIYKHILEIIKSKPVTVITGARQVGKTTLCTLIEKELNFSYVSFASPLERNAAKNDPSEFLSLHPAPCIFDEIQKVPELIDYLEGIVDNEIKNGRKNSLYVLTGSQAFRLMKGIKESMAGRAGLVNMEPLSLSEINKKKEIPFEVNLNIIKKRVSSYNIGISNLYSYIVKGFYPELYDKKNMDFSRFYRDYVQTYLEKDVSDFINIKDKNKFINFMTILASLTGQELIYDNLAKEIGVDKNTIQKWVNVLLAGNIIHLLQPYYETSISKRVLKRPKIYFCDTGLACYLARVNSKDTLINSYLKGPIVETFIINEIIKTYKNNLKDSEVSFYYLRTFDRSEIDLIILKDGTLNLIECKSGQEYKSSDFKYPSILLKSKFKINSKCIICTTNSIYPLKDNVLVLPITSI